MRSAASLEGVKGQSSIIRPRAARVSSVSNIAFTSAPAYTNAEIRVSKGPIRGGGLEENKNCGYPSQDRNILGKRARKVAESRVEMSTCDYPPTKKHRLKDSKRRISDADSDSPGQVNEGITWRYGGLESEDEDCEYRAALLGERFNISLIMTVGGTTTLVQPPTYESRVERPRHRIRDTDSNLPHGVSDNDDWSKKFIPTYKKWLSTRVKPWIDDNDKSVAALQVIWRAVYPHIDYVIDADCSEYRLANHRLDDWRSSIDSAAIDLFKSRYEDLGFSSKETISDASKLLRNDRFMYAETTGKTQKEYNGLFRSPFIVALVAGYYDSISGAIRIPEFEHAFSHDQRKLVKYLETRLRALDPDSREALEIAVKLDTMRMCPKGVLAVCITAVEHALGIFAQAGGALFTRHSNKWTEKVQKYSNFVERKLSLGSMEEIVLEACPLMNSGTTISSISVQVLNDSDDEETLES